MRDGRKHPAHRAGVNPLKFWLPIYGEFEEKRPSGAGNSHERRPAFVRVILKKKRDHYNGTEPRGVVLNNQGPGRPTHPPVTSSARLRRIFITRQLQYKPSGWVDSDAVRRMRSEYTHTFVGKPQPASWRGGLGREPPRVPHPLTTKPWGLGHNFIHFVSFL